MKPSILSFTLMFLFSLSLSAQEKRMTTMEYIDSFKNSAIEEMAISRVPASITLAQGILESSSGNSRLAKEGNNHFGIKCKKSWTGNVIYEDDDALQECFRAYPNALESYKDHSAFLRNNQRYAFLFELEITDYKGWAKGLQKAGYATNKKYGQMLISLIDRFELHQYDFEKPIEKKATKDTLSKTENTKTVKTKLDPSEKIKKYSIYKKKHGVNKTRIDVKTIKPRIALASKVSTPVRNIEIKAPIKEPYTIRTHVVEKGESLYSIAMRYDVTPEDLRISNALKSDILSEGQTLVIAKATQNTPSIKREISPNKIHIEEEESVKTEKDSKQHVVKKGETLYSISRAYNITVESLKTQNNLQTSDLKEGQILLIAQ